MSNAEEDRGFDDEVLFRDKFITGWVIAWFIPSLILYCFFLKFDCNTIKIALIVNTLYLLRSILEIISWMAWCITLEYDENSLTFIVDVAIIAMHILSVSALYLFFMYRLHTLYKQSQIGNYHCYVLLIILCVINLCSGVLLTICFYIYQTTFYIILHLTCLILEIIMYCILSWLFSKPLITIAVNHRREDKTFLTKSNTIRRKNKTEDNLLRILTKLNILNTISLLSSILLRGFDITWYLYCPDECDLSYFVYSLWPIDSFLNIFCVYCSYANGEYMYTKCCNRVHEFVLLKWVGGIIDKKLRDIHGIETRHATNSDKQATNSDKQATNSDKRNVPEIENAIDDGLQIKTKTKKNDDGVDTHVELEDVLT